MSTGKHTTFTQIIEHLGRHSKIRNSAHRKPSTVLFNSSSGTTITEAVNVQHISIFGICDAVRHFSQHSYNIAVNSRNGQLTLHTDSHASDCGALRREERAITDAKSKLLYSETSLSLKRFGIECIYLYIYNFCLEWSILWSPWLFSLPPEGVKFHSVLAPSLQRVTSRHWAFLIIVKNK
jgi:hypothetical protein